jgi:NitT/TauT family transport system ATP-binding protein
MDGGASMSKVPLLRVQKLWKNFGEQVVLENLSFDVLPHEFVTIVGASGCGKTTFLQLLLGTERASRGQILLDGQPLPDEPGAQRGIVFQRYALFPNLTVTEHLLLPQELSRAPLSGRLFGSSRRAARERSHALLRDVGLFDARDRYPHQLSGGMQQRLSIAQSVIAEPRMLLLDEPFGALDPGVTSDMHRLILELWRRREMTVFMVTHDIQEGFTLGTRMLVFDRPPPGTTGQGGARITYDIPLKRPAEAGAPLAG